MEQNKTATTYGIALCPDGARTFEVTASFDESVGDDGPFALDGIGYDDPTIVSGVADRIASTLKYADVTVPAAGIRVSISPALTEHQSDVKPFDPAAELELAIAVSIARLCGAVVRIHDGHSEIDVNDFAYSGNFNQYGHIMPNKTGNVARLIEAGTKHHLVTNCDEMRIDGYDMIHDVHVLRDIVLPNATPVITAITEALDAHGIVVVDVSDAHKQYRHATGRMSEEWNMRIDGYLAQLESSVETAANSLPRVSKFKRKNVAKAMSESMSLDDNALAMLASGLRPYSCVDCLPVANRHMHDVSDFIGDESNGNAGYMTRCACGVLLVTHADNLLSDTIKQLRDVIRQGRITTSDGRVRPLPAVTVFACDARPSAENIAKDLGVGITEYAEFDIERAIEYGSE